MMKHMVGLMLAVPLLGSSWVHAQVGFSVDGPVTSDTQIIDWGLPVFAFDLNDLSNGSTTEVNGMDFSGDTVGADLTISGFTRPGAGDSASSTLTGNFGDVLSIAYTARSGSGMVSLSGLTSGHTYELQLFAGSAEPVDSENVSDGTSSGTLAFGGDGNGVDSIIDTFVPVGTTENFNFTSTDGEAAYLDAIVLREASVADADPPSDPSPEPSTLALLLAGVVLMPGLAKRRGTGALSR